MLSDYSHEPEAEQFALPLSSKHSIQDKLSILSVALPVRKKNPNVVQGNVLLTRTI